MPDRLVEKFTRHMVCGVAYLHDAGVIHRDIKGSNVLLTLDGTAKLADFGCSKLLDELDANERDSTLRQIRGSVPWLAPEVLRQSSYHFPSDIWSLGATVLEMASGKRPWPELKEQLPAIFQIGNSKNHPPIPADVSKRVKDFLAHCFQVDPSMRFTASQLLADPFVAHPNAAL